MASTLCLCSAARSLAGHGFRQLLQSLLQLQRELLVALLTHWLHVKLHKLVPVGSKWFKVANVKSEIITASQTACRSFEWHAGLWVSPYDTISLHVLS